jgi:hypothetical protein
VPDTPFTLRFTPEATAVLQALRTQQQHADKLKRVNKALGLLQRDPRYPSLQSHTYTSLAGANGEEVWDSYVENRTSSAWRVFWHSDPGPGTITVVTISPHP